MATNLSLLFTQPFQFTMRTYIHIAYTNIYKTFIKWHLTQQNKVLRLTKLNITYSGIRLCLYVCVGKVHMCKNILYICQSNFK